jgi:hypothetical protein
VFTTARQLHTFGSKLVTQLKPDSAREDVGKAIKYLFIFGATTEAAK